MIIQLEPIININKKILITLSNSDEEYHYYRITNGRIKL